MSEERLELCLLIPIHDFNHYQKKMIESLKVQDSESFMVYFGFNGISREKFFDCEKSLSKLINKTFSFKSLYNETGDANLMRQILFEKSNSDIPYVMYLDSDDRLAKENSLSEIINLKKEHSPDILCLNISTTDDSGETIYFKDRLEFKYGDKLLDKTKNTNQIIEDYRSNIVAKVINRHLLEGINFKSLPMFQDWNISGKLYDRFFSIYNSTTVHYLYIHREDSVSNSFRREKLFKLAECVKDINSNIQKSKYHSHLNISFWLNFLSYSVKSNYYKPFFREYRYFMKEINPFKIISIKQFIKYFFIAIPVTGILYFKFFKDD
ncbi:hypothetical protein DFQ05_1588 [Winogradskyella wandonensis]|uniref:Glycosyl transferase family 2 n=1 Tax=Winogradskyella wandonensis TaxID=1442586 RepID=A0A4R1KTC8_9FLAO|nr:hypothetical protein [Winogradskyella wandonensis]TCK67807.1 hypothetical protein DFQ05_1588 [Winogradskyella wandonensis]